VFLHFTSLHNVLKSMAFMSGLYKSMWIQNTYCATLQVLLVVCRIWSLLSLCKHLPSPAAVTKLFHSDALQLSYSWCENIVHSTLTGYFVAHQVLAVHSWAYHLWITPEWTTASRLTLRDKKEFQSSLPVWGYHHKGTSRRTLCVARWGGRYVEVTPTQSSRID